MKALTPYELGVRVGGFVRGASGRTGASQLKSLVADLMGRDNLLMQPIQSVVASPHFLNVLNSDPAHSSVHIQGFLREYSGIYTSEVLSQLGEFLAGLSGCEPPVEVKESSRSWRHITLVFSAISITLAGIYFLGQHRLSLLYMLFNSRPTGEKITPNPTTSGINSSVDGQSERPIPPVVDVAADEYRLRLDEADKALAEASSLAKRYATYQFPYGNCFKRDLRFGPEHPNSECGKIQIKETALLADARTALFQVPQSSSLYPRVSLLLRRIEDLETYRRADSHWIEENGSGWCGSGGCWWPEPGQHGRPLLPELTN
jgi:hypothetical protein